ncbi:coiled-coil domain-containing protein 43-like [Macrobrachium nipponense]|uniref:coiled-coil domain-containing protein 43-like n=1 Tax=Macrobrachium nipponense TaxID=159736 RepID=UPI0030C8BCFB
MAEALPCDFDAWLKDTLVGLNTDDEVFSSYIKSILESEENADEKMEALQGILTEITESGIDELCQDILKKWTLIEEGKVSENNDKSKVELDAKIAKIMEAQAQCVTQTKTISKEQEKLKSAILAQYAQVSDGEVTDDEEEPDGSGAIGFCLKNTNAEDVVRAERERRDKDKEEAQRKKDKDKEDRAKQKAKDEERKEKEKKRTQKGERRR